MPHTKTYRYFVGVDTHKFSHTAVLIDQTFQSLGVFETEALPTRYPGFIRPILAKSKKQNLIFGLEDISGFGASLYRFLCHNNLPVREINPVNTKRERLHKTHPDKSDPDDAFDIAKVLAEKWRSLPTYQRPDTVQVLQYLTRQREALVHNMTTAKNRLHALLHQFYPGYKLFFPDVFAEAALSFWAEHACPEELKNCSKSRLVQTLTNCFPAGKCHKLAEKILPLITLEHITPTLAQAYTAIVPSLVADIRSLAFKIKSLTPQLEALLDQTPYQLHTMPALGTVSAAHIVAQVAPIERFASADKLARFIGIAPAKWGSAKKVRYIKSLRGRRSLHQTFYLIALSQIATNRNGKPRCPHARKYFDRKVKQGKSTSVALKCLQRRLVDIVYAMMKHQTAYNPKLSKNKN